MNKNHITAGIIVFVFVLFSVFTILKSKQDTVLNVISPTELQILHHNKKTTDNYETICIEGVEVFSLTPDKEFIDKYSKALKISHSDIISMGYLAQEYIQKSYTNKQISVVYTPKTTSYCKYAIVKYNGMLYSDLIAKSGFGIKNGKIGNEKKYRTNLEKARKLNLVILNHHSNKYHKLDCPYGNAAHDSIIIPTNQVPKNASPCKFCHNINNNLKKLNSKRTEEQEKIPNIISPKTTYSDGFIRTYITNYTTKLKPDTLCNTSVCQEFVRLINSSTKTIDIAAYGYDNIPAVTSALSNARKRGVNIRFVYDGTYKSHSDHYKDNNLIVELSSASTSDKTNNETSSNYIMHNKFIIFDDNTVFTGSLNLSRSGFSDYDVNNIIILKSKEIASLYKAEFEQMLSGKFHKQKSKLNSNNKFTLGNSVIEVYFSPKDNSDTRIIELINNAKKYIYMPTFLITHDGIANALINAKKRGVDVRVIIDANSTTTRNSKHKILRDSGILLKTENIAGKLHLKTIIIDDEYLITGSMNYSNSGVNKNDENLLVIKDKNLSVNAKQFFLYLWTIIPNKYLRQNARAEAPESIGSCSDGVDNNFNGKIDAEEEACSAKH